MSWPKTAQNPGTQKKAPAAGFTERTHLEATFDQLRWPRQSVVRNDRARVQGHDAAVSNHHASAQMAFQELQRGLMDRVDALLQQHRAESLLSQEQRVELQEYEADYAAWQSEAADQAAQTAGAENAAALEKLYGQPWDAPLQAAYRAADMLVPAAGPALSLAGAPPVPMPIDGGRT